MIQRREEDRRSDHKGRKNIGRRKEERYSVVAYKAVIVIMILLMISHITLILMNLK